MNKKTRRIFISLSLFLIFLAAVLVVDKISPAFSIGGAWCDYNPSCMSSPCYCSTGTQSPSNCASGKWSVSGSDSSVDCKFNCPAGETDGYSYNEINHSKSISVSKSACYRTEGGEYTATASCNDGTVTISNVSALSCFSGYKYVFGNWYQDNYGCYYVCVDDNCPAGTIDGYSYTALTHGDNLPVSKTLTAGSCSATVACGDGSVWVHSESCDSNPGYYESGGDFFTCTANYYCTGDNTRTPCPANMDSPAGSDALNDCVCRWGYNTSTFESYCYSNCNGNLSDGCEEFNYGSALCDLSWNSDPWDDAAGVCCNDGSCVASIGETVANCIDDCGYCGDGICHRNEGPLSCPQDCGWCGDGFCNLDFEDASSCPGDCGTTGCVHDTECDSPQICCNGDCCDTCNSGVCALCPPGKYNNGSGSCVCCPIGKYQAFIGQSYCDSCQIGYTTSNTCSTSSSDCYWTGS